MAKPIFENREIEVPSDSAVTYNPEAFDALINSQGVKLIHYSATRCPVGLVNESDTTYRPHEDHENCSNGFIYTEMGTITGLFVSNSISKRDTGAGLGDSSSVRVTLARFYEDDCCVQDPYNPVFVAPFDRFYLKEDAGLEVVHWQLHTTSRTGIDRLSFPVKNVLLLIDSQGKKYKKDADFVLTPQGWLKWIPNHEPIGNVGETPSAIYSVRYTYRPYFYVASLPHEIRVAQTIDELSGERIVSRLPQTVVMNREYNHMSKGDDVATDSMAVRQQYLPNNGSLGPR